MLSSSATAVIWVRQKQKKRAVVRMRLCYLLILGYGITWRPISRYLGIVVDWGL